MSLADDLDGFVGGLDEIHDEPPPVPEDADGANRLLRRLARFEREQAEIDAVAEKEALRIEAWRADRSVGVQSQIGFHKTTLEQWARKVIGERLAQNPKAPKTISLPNGSVSLRAPKPHLEFNEATIDELRKVHPEWVKPKWQIDKALVTQELPRFSPVPGLSLVTPELDSFSYKTGGD